MKKDIFLRVSETVFIAAMILFCFITTMDGIKERRQIKDLQDQITELASKSDAGLNNVNRKIADMKIETTKATDKVRFTEERMKKELASVTDAMEDLREDLEYEIDSITTEAPQEEPQPETTEESGIVGSAMAIKTEHTYIEELEDADNPKQEKNPVPSGAHLTKEGGVFNFEGHTETYYNLDMSVVVQVAHDRGIGGEYHVREDGAKMLGDYIMVAANYDIHPYGSFMNTSLGMGIVVDTGGFVAWNPTGCDLATNW